MTEQNLSLDEMIELAKVFNDKGKWSLDIDSTGHLTVFKTAELRKVYMELNYQVTPIHYSIHLLISGRDSNDRIQVENYFIEKDTPVEYKKMQELYYLIEKGVRAARVEEQRRRNSESFARHELVRQRKEQAIDAAKKLIKR